MRRLASTTSGIIGFAALLLLAAPSTARAGDPHHRGHGHGYSHHEIRTHHGHRSYRSGRAVYGGFAVPHRIHGPAYRTYRPYYTGSVYHGAHHHRHRIYRFPVYSPYSGPVYRTYAYCDGNLYGGPVTGYGVAYDGGFHASVRTRHLQVDYHGR
ncbi:MAG: hypothetical protein ACE5IK_03015 [Acidobacteriota bacterium]